MTTSEMIRKICEQQNMTLTELARRLGQSRQNLFKKLKNNTLSHDELNRIAGILNLEYNQIFTMPDGKQMEVVVDGDTESIQSRAIQTSLGTIYEELALINPFTHVVKILHRAADAPVPSYFGTDDFDSRNFEDIVDMIHPEDRQNYTGAFAWDALRKLMQRERVYDIRFRLIADDTVQHKLLRLTRVDKDEQLGSYEVLAAVSSRAEEQQREQHALEISENRIRLSRTISEYAAALIGSGDVDETIDRMLGIFCRYYMGDRAFIFSIDSGRNGAVLDYEYVAQGIRRRYEKEKRVSIVPIRSVIDVLENGGIYYASKTDPAAKMTEEKHRMLESNGVNAVVIAAIRENGRITGFWGVENPNMNTEDVMLVESSASLIGEALFKKKKLAEMQQKKEQGGVSEDREALSILTSEFTGVFYIDLVTGMMKPYSMDAETKKRFGVGAENTRYMDAIRRYADTMVIGEDRQMFLKAGSVGNIMVELRKKKTFVVTYRSDSSGEVHYCEMKYIRADNGTDVPTAVVLAFADKDNELRTKIENERRNRQDNEIIKILASEYASVYYVDLLTQEISIYSLEENADKKLGSFLRSDVRYTEAYKLCVDSFVYPDDRPMMRQAGSLYNVLNELQDKKSYSVTYRAMGTDGPRYSEMRFVKVGDDPNPQAMALGFADRHEEYLARRREQLQLERRVRLAETMNRCMELLLNAENVEEALENILQILCEYYRCGHACIFEMDETGTSMGISYLYGVDSGDVLKKAMQSIPLDHFSRWLHEYERNGLIYVRDLGNGIISELQREFLTSQGIRSFLAVPTYHENRIQGFWGVDAQDLQEEDYAFIRSLALIVNMALLKRKERKAVELYEHDQLTGLYSWNAFRERSLRLIADDRRTGEPTILLQTDLDNLKEINDCFGHDEGDAALVHMARIFKKIAEEHHGIAGRLGGDEFALAVPCGDIDAPESYFRFLIEEELNRLNQDAGLPYRLTSSCGIVRIAPEDPRSFDELLSEADRKMYALKAQKK